MKSRKLSLTLAIVPALLFLAVSHVDGAAAESGLVKVAGKLAVESICPPFDHSCDDVSGGGRVATRR